MSILILVIMHEPKVSVRPWDNGDHWNKNKGGLNIHVQSSEQARRDAQNQKFIRLMKILAICLTIIIVIAVIVTVVVTNLPEKKVEPPRGMYKISRRPFILFSTILFSATRVKEIQSRQRSHIQWSKMRLAILDAKQRMRFCHTRQQTV